MTRTSRALAVCTTLLALACSNPPRMGNGRDAGGGRTPDTGRQSGVDSGSTRTDARRPGPMTTFDGGDNCGGDAYVAERQGLELHLVYDYSGSMIFPANGISGPSRWDVAKMEMDNFLNDPGSAGLTVSLKYFGEECNADFYATPDIDPGALPGHASVLMGSLNAIFLPTSNTTTHPALQGGIQYVRARLGQPDRERNRIVILLVTDGAPDESDCAGNTIDNVAIAARDGFEGNPSIPTYVFATAGGLALDQIAVAGGTGQALTADLGQPGALARLMGEVRNQELAALPCDYAMPEDYATVNDRSLVNLVRDGEAIPQVANEAACGPTGGWHYDNESGTPTRVIACEATCAQLAESTSVEVVLGCPTLI